MPASLCARPAPLFAPQRGSAHPRAPRAPPAGHPTICGSGLFVLCEPCSNLLSHRGGPALVADGVWTQGRALPANLIEDVVCPRCGEDVESSWHSFRTCSHSSQNLLLLRESSPELAGVPAGLPSCLARCGIPPVGTTLSADSTLKIQHYLLKIYEKQNRALHQAS